VKVLALVWGLLLAADAGDPVFHGTQGPVPNAVTIQMRQRSWREGCPTPIGELAYLRLSYLGFDGAAHEGELVVHKDVAGDVLAIFKALFERRFAIEKMRLVDAYGGDDDASMADNNTSAFNCRFVAGKPGAYSKHSFGRAIDINPRSNPMIVAGVVAPPAGAAFVDRQKQVPGMVRAGDAVVREFARRGWKWGGDWVSMKDYQHFEK
jgi:hypothetical protein